MNPSPRFLLCFYLLASTLLLASCNRSTEPPHAASTVPKKAAPAKLSLVRRMARARQFFIDSQLVPCEEELRAVLAEDPDHIEANRVLALLLNTEGRQWESAKCTFRLLQLGNFTIQDLIMLGSPQEPYEDLPVIEAALERTPDDPRPATGLVQSLRDDNRDQEALDFLRQIVTRYPNQVEAQAQLGLLLLDLKKENDFLHWRGDLPAAAEDHPLVWLVFGIWAERHNQLAEAARCYWEAIRRAPNHRTANYNLGLVLNKLDRKEESIRFLDRSKQLADLETTVHPMFEKGPNVTSVRKAAQLTQAMGRLWEAWGWQVVLLSLEPNDASAARQRHSLKVTLDRDDPPQVLVASQPSTTVDLSKFPLPRFPASSSKPSAVEQDNLARVNFANVAAEIGIQFRYFDSWVAAQRELMLLETIGGGVAILDYDNDGWPDIYFTQCCKWPVNLADTTHLDRLYRNLGNGQFQDVTQQCGIRDNGYTQGVAAGDFDNDGFPDLYTANVGQNYLWHNNGDGTFSRVAHHQDRRIVWTTSAVIADLNGDTLPDIFDVNYLVGEHLYTKHCVMDGRIRSCGPARFDGEKDALFLNEGNGQWRDVSQQAGLDQLAGMGLGIIAADFDRSDQMQLFVSNDVRANFFLINQVESPGSVPQYVDEGTLTGTAFDRSGRSQASMGVTCDDVNGDALLDLVVGNYYNDCNTVYIQQQGRLFADETREFGMRNPSFLLLTFGCQLLDGDLDGWPDLIISNGHVDDFRWRGEPWHMRPQYFRNEKGKQFVELPADRAGNYFEKEYLGRGIALVDWNRDGREEFAVSNIADYAAVTVNRTKNTGHWLALRLRGVQSARDAISTEVAIEFGGRSRTRQLVAGSGFEASNQKQLVFGLASATQVDALRVTWPSGVEQRFTNIAADHEYTLIEGDTRLHPLPRDETPTSSR